METQKTVLDVVTDLSRIHQKRKRSIIYHKTTCLINDLTISEIKIIQEKTNAKEISKLERKENNVCGKF